MERTERQPSAIIVKLLHFGNTQIISSYPDSNLINLSQPASTRSDFKAYRKRNVSSWSYRPSKWSTDVRAAVNRNLDVCSIPAARDEMPRCSIGKNCCSDYLKRVEVVYAGVKLYLLCCIAVKYNPLPVVCSASLGQESCVGLALCQVPGLSPKRKEEMIRAGRKVCGVERTEGTCYPAVSE